MHTTKVDLDQLTVRKLNERVNLSDFNCSIDDELGLNEFIHEEAMDYQRESLGVTHLFYYKDRLVGYATVAMGSIMVRYTRLSLPFFGVKKRYPALLLGRLGVDNSYRNRHIGMCICLWAIGLARELSKMIGCRFVVLMTDQSRIDFYQKCGFDVCPKFEKKMKVLMYFQTF